MKPLTVVVGMIIVHTANVDVQDGLTNGSTDVVKHIEHKNGRIKTSKFFFVLFDDPRVGRTTREKYRKIFNSSNHTQWTPVFLCKINIYNELPNISENPISIDTSIW